MRTRVTLRRSQGTTVDLVVTTDVGATVTDVADAIARAEGAGGRAPASSAVTLAVTPPDGGATRSLPRNVGLAEAGLRAGSTIALVPASDRFAEPGVDLSQAYARLTVVSGPQAGLEMNLPKGTTMVGRGQRSAVRLTDQMVSKNHARILVSDAIEIVDTGSANGVIFGGVQVARAALGPSDYVMLGETVIKVTRLRPADAVGDSGATVQFNRSPRVVPTCPERSVEAPKPPEPLKPGRFPILALVAPLLMGLVLFLLWHNPMSVIFVALSPLLMVGTYVDKRVTDRKRLTTQTADFKKGLDQLTQELAAAHEEETTTRLGELPSMAEALRAGLSLDPLLWSRRPEHDTFLTVRVGTGAAPSRTSITMPPRGSAVAGHWAELEALRDRFTKVEGVPLAVDLQESGALGVAVGDGALALSGVPKGISWVADQFSPPDPLGLDT